MPTEGGAAALGFEEIQREAGGRYFRL